MGIRRLTLTRAIRVARGNDVACREAGDTKSTLISASWASYTLSSMTICRVIHFCMYSVARARDCIVVLFPKVGKCNQTNDTYTFKQSKILQISLQLR